MGNNARSDEGLHYGCEGKDGGVETGWIIRKILTQSKIRGIYNRT
jgi:hypothetical protein